MRIGQDLIRNINNVANDNSKAPSYQKGSTFLGRVISIDGASLDILMQGGARIKAFSNLNVNLPLDTPIAFEVIDNNESTLVLKPLIEQDVRPVSKQDVTVGFLTGIGLKPSAENIKFVNDKGYVFGKAMENTFSAAELNGESLKNALIGIGDLPRYISEFNQDDGMTLLNKLSDLMAENSKDGNGAKTFINAASNLLKGLLVESNHQYPVMFIPVPLYFNDKLYNGEIFLESKGESNDKKTVFAYIFADTPAGSVEATIKATDIYMDLSIYCSKDMISLFDKHFPEIRKIVSDNGFSLKNVEVQELKKKKDYMDIVQKYVKPYTALDVKV